MKGQIFTSFDCFDEKTEKNSFKLKDHPLQVNLDQDLSKIFIILLIFFVKKIDGKYKIYEMQTLRLIIQW